MVFSYRAAALLAALALGLGSAASAMTTAKQGISNGELLRFIYTARYPLGCVDADAAARALRQNPTSDVATLHHIMAVDLACARGPYGLHSRELANGAITSASAAALLAARHESGADALRDARAARAGSKRVVDDRKDYHFQPSIFTEMAGRINRDANALLEAMRA